MGKLSNFAKNAIAFTEVPETLGSLGKQRKRWARGMIQIFRLDNPLLGKGLSFAQRLCYLSATTYFFFAVPCIIFMVTPLLYLIFGISIVPITSFGHLLVHGAMDMASNIGILGLTMGLFDLTAAGISVAIVCAFFLSLIFKPRD